jgi:hypothetical protein
MLAAFAPTVLAQNSTIAQSDLAARTLPNAPGFVAVTADSSSSNDDLRPPTSVAPSNSIVASAIVSMPVASRTQKYIEPDQIAPTLNASDKALLGVRSAFSPFAVSGWFVTSGYSQLMNGSPNYGTDRGAYGQRLGAAAIRDATEGVFGDSVMSSFFHEDPRYYRMGPTHNVFVRLIYSSTRPVFTRTDGGRFTPNLALLSGTMGGAALTNLYYPQVNRGMSETLQTFGGSLGGSAVSNIVNEFSGDFKHMLHHGYNPGAREQ